MQKQQSIEAAALRPAAWLSIAIGALGTHADPDLWGHVRFGLDFWHTHHLTAMDPYSFTQDIPWVNHEWASEALMGGAYAALGPAGLLVLKASIALAAYAVIGTALARCRPVVKWGAFAFAVVETIPIVSTLRPHLWSLLLMVAMCRLLAAPTRRALLIVPFLFVAWVNLHGGWIAGLGVLAAWSAGELLERQHRQVRPPLVLGVLLASIGATLINPYGVGLWRFIADTVRLGRADVVEWQPLWRDLPSAVAWSCGIAFLVIAIRKAGPPRRGTGAALAALCLASVRVNRIVPLFVPAAVVLLAPNLEAFVPDTAFVDSRPLLRGRVWVDAALVLIIGAWILNPVLLHGCIEASGDWMADQSIVRALQGSSASGRIVTFFDWGEDALWHLSPRLKVSFDGRRETVYSAATIAEQEAIVTGDAKGLAALQRLHPEYVWLPDAYASRTKQWLQAHGFRIDIDTGRSFLAVRDDLPSVQPLAGNTSACFPGP